MYNWSTDTKILRRDKTKYAIWKLEQSINFGLNGKKLRLSQIHKYWNELRLDPKRKRVLEFWLSSV